ncbi:MAG TPA: hypothetical protein VLA71_08395 [Algoriphagus sp.]|nr:hypothetical protein [Algoriphagus sp.]
MKKFLKAAVCMTAFFVWGCESKEETEIQKPLSEQNFEFQIYDSLVVDYIGNLDLADISIDGSTFLLIDSQTDTLFVTDKEGEILHKFSRKGGGPGFYPNFRLGPPNFLTNSEIIIPASGGFYLYTLSGDPTRTFLPEFNPSYSMINQHNSNLIVRDGNVYYPWEGRLTDKYGVDGKKFQLETQRVEILDLENGTFTPALHFPKESKFSTDEKSYLNVNYLTALQSKGDSLYVIFRNEPVIFGYHFSNLESPASIRRIPFPEFIEKEPKESGKFGKYEMKDLYVGSINNFYPTENHHFLISYTRGLTDEEYEEIFSLESKDRTLFMEEMKKTNTNGMVLFDGKSISTLIKKPFELGYTLKFISEDEIWFTPNYSEVEKDYVVLYKTRLVSN